MARNTDDSEIISTFGDDERDEDEREEEEQENGEEDDDQEEEEGEGEGEEEEEEEEDRPEPQPRPRASANVPIERLNEVLAQNRELMAVVNTLAADRTAKASAAPAAPEEKPFPLVEKIKAANKALLDGDEDGAAKIQLEIEEHRQKVAIAAAKAEAETTAKREAGATVETSAVETAIAGMLQRYKFLNDDDPSVDDATRKELIADMVMFRNRYISEGHSAAAAIQMAAQKVCDPALKQQGGEARPGKSKPGNAMTAAQRIRNAKAAAAQPPALHRAGTSSRARGLDPDSIDVDKLSDEEWDALPRAVKDRLLGKR